MGGLKFSNFNNNNAKQHFLKASYEHILMIHVDFDFCL
jgi:hypothetical protein